MFSRTRTVAVADDAPTLLMRWYTDEALWNSACIRLTTGQTSRLQLPLQRNSGGTAVTTPDLHTTEAPLSQSMASRSGVDVVRRAQLQQLLVYRRLLADARLHHGGVEELAEVHKVVIDVRGLNLRSHARDRSRV